MTDTEKHFICSSPGCNMSFTDEDHLTVHKKKHDMVLNLGSNGKNTTFVDQTPTPTRFIRNCEEVGLFQDLQNVNPFEETFRRAVEAGNTGSLIAPETGITDDTLHTPHIFPHIADVLSANGQILGDSNSDECSTVITVTQKTTEEKSLIETTVSKNVKLHLNDSHDVIKDIKLTSTKNDTLTQIRNVEPDINTSTSPKVLQSPESSQLSINGEEVQLLLKTADGKLMQLTAVPVSESTNTCNTTHPIKQQTVVIKTEPAIKCASRNEVKKPTVSRLSLAKMKLKQVLTKSVGSQGQNQKSTDGIGPPKVDSVPLSKENRDNPNDPHKKMELLERNRASSMRARAKRKAWIQQLERTVTNVNETNVALQMEVKALRQEVAKLKTLLLAHKDCPVTKAMQKGNGIILGPKIISVSAEHIGTVPVAANTAATKRPASQTADASIMAKRKLAAVAPMKNPPPILPKVDAIGVGTSIQSATIVKSLPTLKIMGVSQFLAEKEETKQILIVQNTARKADETSPRQIIQINPNYEMEHAASKSTVT